MANQQQERQSWSNRLAYIMTVAGATVGFGATWRFPYLVGNTEAVLMCFYFVLR
ncbi:Na+-dependent transporters of the SNF family [Mannheimia haemolytica]|uniref:Na+-dependent transporters of the SNF family n=1 Tax=Mannheimia haemolytica TaxID=75985 RepID=A0A378N855_MANHA|nr:Na+-dependent transporters of the SNF family [Mannheimia haemolytica]